MVFALFTHSFPDHARVFTRVEVGDVQAASGVEAQVGGVTGVEFGFAGIEPENANSQVEVVVFEFAPDVLAGRGVCRVVEGNGERAVHSLIAEGLVVFDAGFGADQEALGADFCVRLRKWRDSWPHGDHELGAHFFQFGHHCFGVWVLVFVEAPLPHCGPVDEVGDDHGQGQAAALVFARDFHEFFLAGVAQFRLPQSQCPLRDAGRVTDGVGVGLEDFLGGIAHAHPVVDPLAALGDPAGAFFGEFDAADGGVVPQETVTLVGEDEGNGHFAVSLDEVGDDSLVVEEIVGVLAHSVEAFAGVGGEALVDFVSAETGVDSVGARPPEVLGGFAQDGFAVLLEVEEEAGDSCSTVKVGDDADTPVGEDFFEFVVAGDLGDLCFFHASEAGGRPRFEGS